MDKSQLLALSTASQSHESFSKLYSKPKESFKRRRTETKSSKAKHAENDARIFGLDCEMVITTSNKGDTEVEYSLARASLVEFMLESDEFKTTFDVFVKTPEDRKVKDLLEHVSGVSSEHLSNAEHSLDDVISLLEEHVRPHDLIIGHSLWSDFEALKWWHDNFIDTSLFFKVQSAPRLTLGLKDAVVYASGEIVQAEGAHNPVVDAQYAIKVARFLAYRSGGPFVELEDVPARFKRLLTFHNFEVERENLREVLAKIASDNGGIIGKPLKTSTSKDGVELGSITFEFPDEAAALSALNSFPTNSKLNGCFGFPDQAGFVRKYVEFNLQPPLRGEVISYHRPALTFTSEYTCSKQNVGKIIGQKGARVLQIQRLTGSKISNVPKGTNQVMFIIKADNDEKCQQAVQLMTKAERGDDLGI